MKTLFITTLLLTSSISSAVEIIDEGNVFSQLLRYTSGMKFEDVMKCGQMHNYGADDGVCQFTCNASYCMSSCSPPAAKKFAVAVEDCSADKASIYGENGMNLTVTREDFKKGGNTFILPFLQDIGRYVKPAGKVLLTKVFPKYVAVIENGNKTPTMAYDVTVEVDYGPGMQRPSFSLVVVPTLNDIRSIASFGQMQDSFYRFKGIVTDEGF